MNRSPFSQHKGVVFTRMGEVPDSVEKLRKHYTNCSLTKDKLSKHEYNKFLEISKGVQSVNNKDKIDLSTYLYYLSLTLSASKLKRGEYSPKSGK